MPELLQRAGVSPREAQVLEGVGVRASNAEIAAKLYISVRTVESHVSSLLRKLGAADRFELWEIAQQVGTDTAQGPPYPPALAALAGVGPFVGRAREVDQLLEASKDARRRRRLVLVTGEAGIGKSRLVAEAGARLKDAGASVLFGRCDAEALLPYQPFVEAADVVVDRLPGPLVEEVGPVLAPLLPSLTEEVRPESDSDPELARFRLFEAFDVLLSASPAPIVLVIEDAHWADAPALLLLRHLLRRVDRPGMLVVATARAEGLAPGGELASTLATLDNPALTEEIALSGLSIEAVTELYGEHPGAAGLADPAWRRTGGNPFLLHELLRALDELTDAAAFDELVPDRMRTFVARRVNTLGTDVARLLSAGAVMGEQFDFGVAAAVAGGDTEGLLGTLDRALAAGLVTEISQQPDRYRFVHAIVRDALTQGLTSSRRARLHLGLAHELEGRGATAADVAFHRHAALPAGDSARSFEAAREAAEEALGLLAYERATDFQTMALDATAAGGGDHADRLEALLARGDARLRSGATEHARADFLAAGALAERIGDPLSRARAALGVGDTADIWGEDPGLVEALEGALVSLDAPDMALRARVRARLAQALYYSASRERREELSRVAIREARLSGDRRALASVLSARHAALWGPADLEARIEAAEEIERVASETGDRDLAVVGLGWLAVDRLEQGDRAGFDEAVTRHAGLARELRHPAHLRDAEMWAVTQALLDGRLDAAEEGIPRVRDLGDAAFDPHAGTVSWAQRFWVTYWREDADAFAGLLDEFEPLAARYEHVAAAWRGALALMYAVLGDHEAAREEFEELAVDDFARIPRDVVYVNALTFLAEICHLLGDVVRAGILFELLEPFAGTFALVDRAIYCKGSVDRFMGLLAATAGDRATAESHLSRALAQHEAAGAECLAARTRRELAAVT